MEINIADLSVLTRLLQRKRKSRGIGHEVDLGTVLKAILAWANRFVPSESGSILLDDPVLKLRQKKEGDLYFSASFGKGSASLVGTSLSDRYGIAGETYRSGRPYISEDVRKDKKFYSKIDKMTRYKTRSIICVPISIDGATIGVVELINKKGKISYTRDDLALLEIFAGYTATLIQNALIARSFEELSKIDNLTGLYNDRHFFHTLEHEVERAFRSSSDLTLIFFDLDRFKEVNDTYGHLAGSRVLTEVADILRKIFSGTNAVLSRYGGDEYVIILPDTRLSEAVSMAENVKDSIGGNIFLKKRRGFGLPPLNIKGVITCSIGIASLRENIKPDSIENKNIREIVETLIKSADSAMYRAKELGKNKVCSFK